MVGERLEDMMSKCSVKLSTSAAAAGAVAAYNVEAQWSMREKQDVERRGRIE